MDFFLYIDLMKLIGILLFVLITAYVFHNYIEED